MIKWTRKIGYANDIYYLSDNGMFSIVKFKGHSYMLYKKSAKYLNGKLEFQSEFKTLKAAKAAAERLGK